MSALRSGGEGDSDEKDAVVSSRKGGGAGSRRGLVRRRVMDLARELLSRFSRFLSSIAGRFWKGAGGDGVDGGDATGTATTSKMRMRRRRRRLIPASALLGLYLLAAPPLTPPAHAKCSYELADTPTYSLRPGMTSDDAEKAASGDADVIKSNRGFQAGEGTGTGEAKQQQESQSKKKKKASESVYYGDDDEEEFDVDDFDDRVTVGTAQDQVAAKRLKAQTTSQFASNSKGKSAALTAKVAAGLFVPTFGGMFVREFFRRRREEEYVKKGLEILEAQKAEYFNVTETTPDSDVEDALKGLKKNETGANDDDDNDDDDDDDDDDEDDDDEPPSGSSSKRRPKRGGPGGGDGGSSGGGEDPGYGKASDEDLDKLKKMFDKS